ALDFDMIKAIAGKTDVPLVLHGGTGISPEDLKEAISLGMCKINVGTVMKRVYIETLQRELSSSGIAATDPHELIGGGGPLDIMVKAREAVTDCVIHFIRLFGSENKAKMM
ncbi:MAG: class II fructose-bisphosphate aldolase, partial [Clostridia bacterium]|nr:class II fructose-bisphosphate aldolase [Clostridia bacterium]